MSFYTVIGLGRFGSRLAAELYAHDADVLAIDLQESMVNQIADHVTRAAVADAKNKDVLRALGVQDCDCAIVSIGSDLAGSVLITMNLKALGVKKIICKAHDELHREILEKLGADQIIIPEHVVADKLAVNLTSPDVLEYINLSSDYGILELKTPKSWQGNTLRGLKIRTNYGVTIIAIRTGEQIRVSPEPDSVINEKDVLVVLGDYPSLERLKDGRI